LGALGINSTACAAQLSSNKPTPIIIKGTESPDNSQMSQPAVNTKSNTQQLPEFQGISQWLNYDPLTIQELKGNVELIQFWTFSCINCRRTLPQLMSYFAMNVARLVNESQKLRLGADGFLPRLYRYALR